MKADSLADDPQLTAYALGELEGAARAAVEARLAHDAAARAAVEEIRAMAGHLHAAMAAETTEATAKEGASARQAGATQGEAVYERKQARVLRFPQMYFVIAGVAAACFAVVLAIKEPEYRARQMQRVAEKKLHEDAFTKALRMRQAQARAADEAARAQQSFNSDTVLELPAALPKVAEPTADALGYASNEKARLVGGTVLGQTTFAGAVSQTLRDFNTEAYAYQTEGDFIAAALEPLSTFSIDVDTASYANVRRFLESGRRPPVDAVRIEELVNYFPYHYAAPGRVRGEGTPPTKEEAAPFAASMAVASAPWAPEHRLVRIGLKAREVSAAERGAANLVFLLDVSGSMNQPNKLPLVKESMRLLVSRLRPDDTVAIVTYAGRSGLALATTPVKRAAEILGALDELSPGGSTNGAQGIQLAYDVAKAHFVSGGINHVVLCTDGDFNVGMTSEGELTRLITEQAKSGVFLTVLGFGMGNYKDATLEKLADSGNGNYGYVDNRREAEKLLVEQVSGTLVTVAKDVKLQVEFNPAKVARYRLIGYENRRLENRDFNNDKVDAGEIGAGHTVTALYEIVPVGTKDADAAASGPAIDPLKYAAVKAPSTKDQVPNSEELLTLKVRYKEPAGDKSRKLEFPLVDRGAAFADADGDFKFAASVAAFGMILRDSPQKGSATLANVVAWAESGAGADAGGYRAEFIQLARRAETLVN
ncbi:VWA domain-containing protein [Horticoccus luteus]|uniref:VWA domain-containing protein n=1 Tax=Horticoccus luteus TaxID=2862869 RepID=A0A8F9TX10_9BACT|nr:VWA domain-containing protein [Horticoccus luteus]QYM79399.1 VWA domain-containing protein [Horticoccus luteus]